MHFGALAALSLSFQDLPTTGTASLHGNDAAGEVSSGSLVLRLRSRAAEGAQSRNVELGPPGVDVRSRGKVGDAEQLRGAGRAEVGRGHAVRADGGKADAEVDDGGRVERSGIADDGARRTGSRGAELVVIGALGVAQEGRWTERGGIGEAITGE